MTHTKKWTISAHLFYHELSLYSEPVTVITALFQLIFIFANIFSAQTISFHVSSFRCVNNSSNEYFDFKFKITHRLQPNSIVCFRSFFFFVHHQNCILSRTEMTIFLLNFFLSRHFHLRKNRITHFRVLCFLCVWIEITCLECVFYYVALCLFCRNMECKIWKVIFN